MAETDEIHPLVLEQLDKLTEALSAIMEAHELLYGKMQKDVVLRGYGKANDWTN